MDFLAAEISKSKAKLGLAKKAGKRFIRRGEAAALSGGGTTSAKKEQAEAAPPTAKRARTEGTDVGSQQDPHSPSDHPVLSMSEAAVKEALRQFREPVTLFGETQAKRAARLLALEQEKGGDTMVAAGYEFNRDGGGKTAAAGSDDEGVAGAGRAAAVPPNMVLKSDFETEALFLRAFFKSILRKWEAEMAARPAAERATAAGRAAGREVTQAKDFMRPFFKLCKGGRVLPSMQERVATMVSLCQAQEYVKAESEYFDLSIGRAAWPMGVTNTGIHTRASRTKLHTDNIAHVMNDERQRKYLTTMKRLMTEYERWYPTDPSRMTRHMGPG